jgi:hypothetical protein
MKEMARRLVDSGLGSQTPDHRIDVNLSGAKLIASVLSAVALVAMLVTSLQWLAVVVAGLGVVMSVQMARHRTDRQLRTHS